MDGQYVTRRTRRFAHVSRCFAHVSRMFRNFHTGHFACFAHVSRCFAHVSRLSHWAFRMFRTCFAHVSRLSQLGISHISRMLRGTSHIFRRLHTSHHTYFTIGVRPADTQEHNVCRGPLSPGLDVLDVRLDASSMQDRRMASAQPRHLDTSSTLTPVTPPVVNVKDPRHLDA